MDSALKASVDQIYFIENDSIFKQQTLEYLKYSKSVFDNIHSFPEWKTSFSAAFMRSTSSPLSPYVMACEMTHCLQQ
ncbi:unnamed protein product [Brugia timori]|uniref:Glycosyl transferase n=1 Tax=Brugia timori TaxID=42155 RepID=A0A0R3QBC8_9BILA|nr:unnamed protein product [Brugia timori]